MPIEQTSQRLRALPVQLVEIPEGVILKRGCSEIRIAGEGAKDAVERLLLILAGEGTSVDEVLSGFAQADRPAVESLIGQLSARRFLVATDAQEEAEAPGPEGPLDVFYWHFGVHAAEVRDALGTRRISVVGVNGISRRLIESLAAAGITAVEVVDYPPLRNAHFFGDVNGAVASQWPAERHPLLTPREWEDRLPSASPDCVVATTDFGGMHTMRAWNRLCVQQGFDFLPIVLQNLVGYVGPVIVPGETACYECLWQRQNSHLSDPELQRAIEYEALGGQAVVGYHPSMASILADLATMELTKLFSGVIRGRRAGTLIELNMLQPSMDVRKVLKVPRCPVCTPLNRSSPVTTQANTLLPFD